MKTQFRNREDERLHRKPNHTLQRYVKQNREDNKKKRRELAPVGEGEAEEQTTVVVGERIRV